MLHSDYIHQSGLQIPCTSFPLSYCDKDVSKRDDRPDEQNMKKSDAKMPNANSLEISTLEKTRLQV